MPSREQMRETLSCMLQVLEMTYEDAGPVGAYRRQFPTMERLDLLVVSRTTQVRDLGGERPVPAVLEAIREAREAGHLRSGGLSGPRVQQVVCTRTEQIVWVYLCDAPQWGWYLVLRTGPRRFVDAVLRGLAGHGYRTQQGHLVDRSGKAWDGASERQILELALGRYVAPEDRR